MATKRQRGCAHFDGCEVYFVPCGFLAGSFKIYFIYKLISTVIISGFIPQMKIAFNESVVFNNVNIYADLALSVIDIYSYIGH